MRASLYALMGLVFVSLAAAAAGVAFAAEPAGTVTGVVKDALARPIGGAAVRLETADGGVVARTTADAQGRFAFTNIAPGSYALVGEKTGFDTATAIVTVSALEGARADVTMASQQPLDVKVAAKRLEEARLAIQPRVGASTYQITNEAIQAQPGGDNNTISQVLLQAPGVTQDSTSQGGIHVRNEHGNLQYRINGVALPEGVSLFGQNGGLSPRLASSIELITGALPAQYGLRTAGIVDIQTKSGVFEPGGYVGMYGGSQNWLQPSAEYRGSLGRLNYFVSGDYLHNDIGITPATPHRPIHDETDQGHGFAYLEYLIDATRKVSLFGGSFVGEFQIPTGPFASPMFTANGVSFFDSAKVRENQEEQNHYVVLSYLQAEKDYSVQLSTFARYSVLRFRPDPLADIIFNGVAQRLDRSNVATGVQLEGSYNVAPAHTVRGGVIVSEERTSVQTTSSVLPTAGGAPTSDVPLRIFDSTGKTGFTYSVYVQDEWKVVPTVTINGGLRFDDIEAFSSEWQLSPRFSVVWTPPTGTTVHVGYARYFTPPPLVFTSTRSLSRFNNTTAAVDTSSNDTIKAERANYVDAGILQQVLPGLKVGVDAYYKQAKNLLDDGQFGSPVFLTPFNYNTAFNWGVEGSVTYTVGGFSAYGNLAAAKQKAKEIVSAQALFSADDLAYIQQHYIDTDHVQLITISAGLSYLWHQTRLSADLIAGSGLRRTVNHPNDATNPPYEQVNVGLTQGFTLPAIGKMQARFDVINVFDRTYVLRDGTGVGVFAKQFGPPREFFGGLRKEF